MLVSRMGDSRRGWCGHCAKEPRPSHERTVEDAERDGDHDRLTAGEDRRDLLERGGPSDRIHQSERRRFESEVEEMSKGIGKT